MKEMLGQYYWLRFVGLCGSITCHPSYQPVHWLYCTILLHFRMFWFLCTVYMKEICYVWTHYHISFNPYSNISYLWLLFCHLFNLVIICDINCVKQVCCIADIFSKKFGCLTRCVTYTFWRLSFVYYFFNHKAVFNSLRGQTPLFLSHPSNTSIVFIECLVWDFFVVVVVVVKARTCTMNTLWPDNCCRLMQF